MTTLSLSALTIIALLALIAIIVAASIHFCDKLGYPLVPAHVNWNAPIDFATKTMAKYNAYLRDENAKYAAQANALEQQTMIQQLCPAYDLVAEIISRAINLTCEQTHLLSVSSPRNIQLGERSRFKRAKNGVIVFAFRSHYELGYGISARDVQRILQHEVNQQCDLYGKPALVVHVTYEADGAVSIKVACWGDILAARQAVK